MELNVNEDFAIIIFIGRLNSEKGCLELIRAARRINLTFQNFHLLMVGPSENGMKEDLEELAASLNLEKRVSLLGERQDIPQLLAFSDILVLPSYREGLGMVLLEAAAAGRPAVTSNIRGCRDVVVDGKTGLLVTPGSVQELADAVLDLLQNVGKRKRMGEAARQHAEKKFDQTYFFTQIDNLYRQLLKEKGLC
jgi:glycosyltransferase involved in cell wall biosynthesis